MSSAAIRFACPVCGGNVRAPSGQLGHDVLCPHCGNSVVVPDPNQRAAPSELPEAVAGEESVVVEEKPRQVRKAPVDPDAPIRLDGEVTEPGEFAVTCPTCETRVAATPDKIGQVLRCPDCYSPVPVLPSEARPGPRREPTRFEDDISFSPPTPTPGYIPAASSGANAADVYSGEGDTQPVAAESAPEDDEEFSMGCPICHTRVSARRSQIGRHMRCPDCETEFQIRAPKAKPKRDHVAPDEGEEFRLSEVFERPKYESTTRGTVSRDDLDLIQLNEAERLPPEPRPSQPATSSPAGRIDFFVMCPTCSSRVGARDDQIGQTIRCSDCNSPVVVTAPRGKKVAPVIDVDDDAELQIDIPHSRDVLTTGPAPTSSEPVPARGPVLAAPVAVPVLRGENNPIQEIYVKQSRDAMNKAEREVESIEEEIKLEDLSPFQQLFSVLTDLAMALRIVYLSAGFTAVLSLMTFASYLVSSGQSPLVGPLLLVFWGVGIALSGFIFKIIINVVQGTAVGQVKIAEWSEDFYTALMTVLQFMIAVGVSGMPGGILSSALYSAGAPPFLLVLLMPFSMFLFFPFVLLSQLEGEHFFHVISLKVATSIRLVPTAWLRCYAESFFLCLMTVGLIFCTSFGLHNIFIRVLVATGLVVTLMLFARSIGILAYACNRALLRQEELAEARGAE